MISGVFKANWYNRLARQNTRQPDFHGDGSLQFHWSQLALFLLLAALAGCALVDSEDKPVGMDQEHGIEPCPITSPNVNVVRNGTHFNYVVRNGWHFDYGNGDLWTSLWPEGTVLFRARGSGRVYSDGSMSMKWPWYLEHGIDGELEIEGRRLGAPSERSLSANHSPVLGDPGFHAGAITFPSEGCWEVTGRAGDVSLTFVTRVVRGRTLQNETPGIP